MDSNGLRFWALLQHDDWLPPTGTTPGLTYDAASGRLRLESESAQATPNETQATASSLLQVAPMTNDAYGCRAWWDPSTGHVMATGAMPDAVPIYAPPAGQTISDVCMGFDGILYLAVAGSLALIDRRGRWTPQTISQAGFNFYRLAAHPSGGAWAINDKGDTLVRVQGEPLANRPLIPMQPNAFDYVQPNRNPPRVSATYSLPSGEQGVALAADPGGIPAVLSWRSGQTACIRRLLPSGQLTAAQIPGALQFPYSIAFLNAQTVALLATGSKEALVFDVGSAADVGSGVQPPLAASGQPYPLPDFVPGPFVHGLSTPPDFPTSDGSATLYPLSYVTYAASAWTPPWQTGSTGVTWQPKVMDSGTAGATWHRLYLEASIPAGCAVRVLLAASDAYPTQADTQLQWYEHRFGAQFNNWEPAPDAIPTGAWAPQPSEIPFHPGLLGCNQPGTKGLFTALVQRGGCSVELPERAAGDSSNVRRGAVVRSLRGRYLRVRVQLLGNGRFTPEVAALRVYASRFSYVEQYLPQLYREQVFSPDADATGDSTRADFLERFVDNFEGLLTVIEDRVASSYLVTRAETASDDSLDWLASWIGLSFDPLWPKDRRRALLLAAPELYREHGTLGGMQLALDAATNGLQSQGAVLVLEDYRVRRIVATILGSDLETPNPLLPGLMQSGNSFVGDTLFLGNQHQEEFLALFGPEVDLSTQEASAVEQFYQQTANQVTVLVHEGIASQQMGLIKRVVDIERPAHVLARVLPASTALLIGIASLLGVDTFLNKRPPVNPVRVDVSDIGRMDVVRQLPALDPRLDAGVAEADVLAKLSVPSGVLEGRNITMNASQSQGAAGSGIAQYIWTIEIINPS